MEKSLLDKLSEQELEIKKSPINVCSIFTFGFNDNHISMTDKELNTQSYNAAIKINPEWEDYQIPVGYEIHNISNSPITDIEIPEYTWYESSKLYEGIIKKVTLKPDERMILPTLYLMVLLMKLKQGMKVGNGEFKPICNLQTDDYDAKLRNVYFIFDSLWEKLEENPLHFKMIGAHEVLDDFTLSKELYIPNEEFQKLFGNLMNQTGVNPSKTGQTSESSKFIKKIIFYN